ncbi:hypothetical protein ACVDG8_006490 [Mesorhizobium sp. ORM8.1]
MSGSGGQTSVAPCSRAIIGMGKALVTCAAGATSAAISSRDTVAIRLTT